MISLLAAIPYFSSYKINLKNGKYINAGDEPVVKGDIAYFLVGNINWYLPAWQIVVPAEEIAPPAKTVRALGVSMEDFIK